MALLKIDDALSKFSDVKTRSVVSIGSEEIKNSQKNYVLEHQSDFSYDKVKLLLTFM